MRKYTLFLLVLLFSFGLFNTNVNSASATTNTTSVSGCLTGDNFSRTTGQACNAYDMPVECRPGDLFSSLTGQPCPVVSGGGGSQDDSSDPVSIFNDLFKSSFKIGSRGDDVKALQQFLKDEGYYFGKVDGKYGRITARAVKDFQEDNNDIISSGGGGGSGAPIPIYQPPIISGVSGPQSLNVNEKGTWTVKASSPYGGNLSYSVIWGDEKEKSLAYNRSEQTATFAHSYSQAGTYTPTFTVTNEKGQTAKTSLSVRVGDATTTPSITVLSPNGGEVYKVGDMLNISWSSSGFSSTGLAEVMLEDIRKTGDTPEHFILDVMVPNSGKYSWKIPASTSFATLGAGSVYKVWVRNSEGISVGADGSDNYFSIVDPTTSTCSSGGFDINTGFRCGCTSTSGYSSVDGQACDGSTINLKITNLSPLLNAKVGSGYDTILYVSGVPGGFTTNNLDWFLTKGDLPPGLYLSASDGGMKIIGTPTQAGTYNFSLTVSNKTLSQTHSMNLSSNTKQFTLTVEPATSTTTTPPYFIITSMEPNATGAIAIVGQAYPGVIGFSTVPEVIASKQIYFDIQGLPPGLVADNYVTLISLSNYGYISFKGTPTQAGIFPVTATFTYGNNYKVSKIFYLTVNPVGTVTTGLPQYTQVPTTPTPAPTPVTCTPLNNSTPPVSVTNSVGTVTVTSPNGGDCLTKGSTSTITWTNSNNIDKVTIYYVAPSGTVGVIASNIVNTGSYSWNVNVGNTINTQFKIKIFGYQTGVGSVIDTSDNFFTVN